MLLVIIGMSCTLPTSDPDVVERMLITGATPFEDILQAIYPPNHSFTQDLHLTWRVSPDRKRAPAAPLRNAAEWARVLERARKKMLRQHKTQKGPDVEIIIGFDKAQVLSLRF